MQNMRIKGFEPVGCSKAKLFVNREPATIPLAETEKRKTGPGHGIRAPTDWRIEGDTQPSIGTPESTTKVTDGKDKSLFFIPSYKVLTIKTSNRAVWIVTSSSLSLVDISRMRNQVLISANGFRIEFGFSDWRLPHAQSDYNPPFSHDCIEFIAPDEATRHRLRFTDNKLIRTVSRFLRQSAVNEKRITARRRMECGRTGKSASTHPCRCDELFTDPCPSIGQFEETREAARKPGVWTNPVDLKALATRMQFLCELQLRVSIRVPFAGGFHAYTGVLDDASIRCQDMRLTGPFASKIEGRGIQSASIVSRSGGRSPTTTLEIYGKDRLPILQLCGAHDAREYAVWQDIMNSLLIEIA